MNEQKDIFDKMMGLSIFKLINPFYTRNKEILLYLFFGALTVIFSIITFALFNIYFGINELIANIFSWIIVVLFAFITNRIWVFENESEGIHGFGKQLMTFYAGRLITLGIEEGILLIFVTMLGYPSIVIKIIAQFIVIILNYFISKLFIFK